MRTTATPTMLTTSERVYQLLLWLYPSDYRREYGADMMQLFRDLRRDALRERGAAGLIDLWMHVIIDFAVSILAEYRRHGASLSGTPFARSSGSLLMLVGCLFALGSISQLQPGSHYNFYGLYLLSFMAFLAALLLMPVGLLSFYALIAPHEGAAAKLFLRLATVGVPAGLLAAVGIGALVQLEDAAWYAALIGVLAHLSGMFLFGIATNELRSRTGWRLLSIAIAVTPFTIFFSSNADSVQGPLYIDFAALVLLGLSWFMFGRNTRITVAGADNAVA